MKNFIHFFGNNETAKKKIIFIISRNIPSLISIYIPSITMIIEEISHILENTKNKIKKCFYKLCLSK